MKINCHNEVRSQKSEARSRISAGLQPSTFNLQPSRERIARGGSGHQPSTINYQPAARGFALVITLILLSVTLIMAVAFLAISRRERGSVVTSTDSATARYAADAALANAEAQIISSVLATTNPYINNLLVSTNYINRQGFATGFSNPTNVNYDYYNNQPGSLSVADFLQNIANLLYLPRVPVYVPTNALGSNDFRFYLDLNRNGKFEDTGLFPAISSDPNNPYFNLAGNTMPNIIPGNTISNLVMGNPQWIGVLERPDAPHGPDNKFLARYAFIALPADGALDLNAIHNQSRHGINATGVNPPPAGDVYFRNQGVGSWEINLAAFLADLNTNVNEWGNDIGQTAIYYRYNQPGNANTGNAFDDARALLAYRYNNTFGSLAFVPALIPNYVLPGSVDILSIGPAMVTTAAPFYYPLPNNFLNQYLWPGADNTNHFFALPSDLFDTNKNSIAFNNRLLLAGATNSTYDRYTFYRLLAQLGTDSSPDAGKLNLNYSNAVAYYFNGAVTNIVVTPNTNLLAWDPLQFFTIAADRMLRLYTTNWFQANPTNYLETYYAIIPGGYLDAGGNGVTNLQYLGQTNVIPAFSLTNIPVYVNGHFVYSSAVQRVLQLAANIYDASVTNFYPSVFRPLFRKDQFSNIFITGYTNLNSSFGVNTVSSSSDLQLSIPSDVATIISKVATGPVPPMDNIYGVPWIVGAKKGLPNFNEFSMQDVVQVTRLLQVTRLTTNSLPNGTNQMYLFGITNSLGVEFWNSYTNGYSNQVQVVVNDSFTMQLALTNNGTITPLAFPIGLVNPVTFGLNTSTNVIIWPGRSFVGSFVVPLNTNKMFLPNSQYDFANEQFDYVGDNPNPSFQTITPYAFANLPQILLQVTNRLQAFALDGNHIIDYVSFAGPQSTRNLNSEIFNTNSQVLSLDSQFTNLVWSTAPDGLGNPLGIDTQIGLSDASIPLPIINGQPSATYWKSAPQWNGSIGAEIDGFRYFLNPLNQPIYNTSTANMQNTTNLAVQAPYAPTLSLYEYTSWQANDPLVHYMQSDLNFIGADPQNGSSGVQTGVHKMAITSTKNLPLLPDLGLVNARYQPWGTTPPTVGTGISQANYNTNKYDLAFRDPLAWNSDRWDFPTNKYPTAGWLGRVHRGTPWQTVFLKAANILHETTTVGTSTYNIGTNTWAVWTGNSANPVDAANSAPLLDRLLFDLFTTAINDNASRGQLSVNVAANSKDPGAGLAAWSALFSGMVALTNTTVAPPFPTTASLQASNSWLVIPPAGGNGLNSALGDLVTNINFTRSLFANADGLVGAFEHKGDILSVAALTEQSPFLNWNNVNQMQQGISDEVYEWLPQQTLSLLRADGNPRYVIYCYGQTLKPAPNGVVTGGPNLANGVSPFGMVTNYQVVAETATRAVVQFRPVVVTNNAVTPPQVQTNYSATLEQFNPLPPD